MKPKRNQIPTIGGDVWTYNGSRFVAESITSGIYIYSSQLKSVIGKNYISPKLCKRVLRNEGMVVYRPASHPLPYGRGLLGGEVKGKIKGSC